MPLNCNVCECISQYVGNGPDQAFHYALLQAVCNISQGQTVDHELACASTNGRLILVTIDNGVTTVTELDGSPILDGATPVSCDEEYTQVETCFQDAIDPSIRFTRVVYFPVNNPGAATTIWLNASGAVVPPPVGVVPCEDDREYVTQETEFCALVDSPANYPNPGDPVGTAYQVGNRIRVSFVSEVDNFFVPVLSAVNNLSNGTFPAPFYLQLNGVDVVGTAPDFPDFGDCAQIIQIPQTPVIDAIPFLAGSEITGVPFLQIFNVPLKGVSVWNGGNDFILAEFTTAPVTTGGNRQMIIPPGGTAQVQIAVSAPELITQVELSTLTGGICPAIVNAVHPGGV